MSYEADAHKVQMQILKELLLVASAPFADLQKSTKLGSDHFTFHVKKLTKEGYIIKNADGNYELTRIGKEYANRMDTDENVIEKQPKLSVVLIIQNSDGRFLAQERLKQPYYGFWGRPTGKIRWGETFIEAAARELTEEAGITANLRVSGFYHKMDYEEVSGDLLEDKLFVLVYGTNPKGKLITEGEGCRNAWLSTAEFDEKERSFQSVADITKIAAGSEHEFIEKKYEYTSDEY
jgi:ADP-ribose pyrophosphatase YjhB (NUDIX family)